MPVEDIIEMHNVDNIITESERYNERIWCHYITCALKICLNNLNEVNNILTWMKSFTQGCHNISKTGSFEIINVNMVQRWHALFRVEGQIIFEKEEEATTIFPSNKLVYFQVNT